MTDAERIAVIDALAAAPAELRAGLARNATPPAGEWGAADIIRHMCAADAIIAPRVMQVLVREGAPLPGLDEIAWASTLASAAVSVETLLDAYAATRAVLVALLRGLDASQWTRTGVHESRGPQTVEVIVQQLAEHEAEHRAQLGSL